VLQAGYVAPSPELVERARVIYLRLLDTFGLPTWDTFDTPLEELISTILSQNTNDRNRDLAYTNLRNRFATWEEVRDAEADQVIEAIRPAGLANQKGPRIQAVLRKITEERGSLDLDFLNQLSPAEAHTWLMRFKGVGPKTTAIVLLFALGKPAFPVDTHIYRVTGRLGLRPPNMTVEETHQLMEALIPSEVYGPAHINLIRLGRSICHARRPDCLVCPLKEMCDYYQRLCTVR
jgi:endonuclease-3